MLPFEICIPTNYLRNLLALTAVPTLLLWVIKLFSSVPMIRRLAQ